MSVEDNNNYLSSGIILKNNYMVQQVHNISNLSISYIGFDINKHSRCLIKEYFPKKLALRDTDNITVVCKTNSLSKIFNKFKINFLNEASIMKNLCHKNIAEYIDDFEENTTHYIVIKLYEAKTLDNYLKENPLIDTKEFLKNIFLPLINAVDFIHNKNIIHRDLKPSNILITENNQIILIDFGSAINFKKDDYNSIFTTYGFSPIEFNSSRSKQGRYSDIYSLAAILYFYISKSVPLDAPKRVIRDDLENIHNFENISKLFSWIIMKNLSINYKKRFSSCKILRILIYICMINIKEKDIIE